MSDQVPLSSFAEVNPLRGKLPADVDEASFITMADVSDTARWLNRQTRQVKDVKSGYTFFREGDVLVAKITPCLENGKGCHAIGLKNAIGFGSTEFHVLRARDNADAAFIFQLTNSAELRQQAAMKMTGSAGQQRVPAQFIADYPIHIFTKAQQSKIAQVLATLDRAITQTDALLAKQQRVKAGLMQELLTSGINADGKMRPSQASASTLYSGWQVRRLGDVAEVASGLTLGRVLEGPNLLTLPYLRVFNVQDGYLDLSDVKTVAIRPDELPRYCLQKGDVLMNEGGDFDKLGRGAVWEGQIELCLHQNHVFRVRTNRKVLLPDFLAWISASAYGKVFFVLNSKQSTNLASINSTQLKSFPIPCPDVEEQERILEVVREQDAVLASTQNSLRKMRSLKAGLMQDLLTGKVSVLPLMNESV